MEIKNKLTVARGEGKRDNKKNGGGLPRKMYKGHMGKDKGGVGKD